MRNGPRAALGADRLDNDARCTAEQHVALEHILQHGQIVRPHLVRRLIAAAGNPVRFQKCPAAGDFQTVDHLVGPAVVRAADLDDALFARRNARDAERRHDGLRAAAEHTEHLDVRHMPVDLFRDHQLGFVQQTCHRAAFVQQFNHLFPDDGIVAAEDRRAAGLQEVNVLVAVLVVEIRAVGPRHAHGKRLVEGQIMLDAAGDILLRLLIHSLGGFALFIEILEDYIVVIVVRDLPYGLTGQRLEPRIDLVGIVPTADAAVVHFCSSFFARSLVSMLPRNTTNVSNRYSVTKFKSIFITVTRYSFQPQLSTSQLPRRVDRGVNTA